MTLSEKLGEVMYITEAVLQVIKSGITGKKEENPSSCPVC